MLHGKILLNLDTEEDDELTIGCAGGVDVTLHHTFASEATPENHQGYRVVVRGLTGGHSGCDIHLGRGNANKLMNRLLFGAAKQHAIRIAEIDGGGLRNAIPRESFATVSVPRERAETMVNWLNSQAELIKAEYATTDPQAEITAEPVDLPATVIPTALQRALLGTIYTVPSGIYRMCPDIDGLVQTSNNLARVLVKDGDVTVLCLTRSSVNSERDDLAEAIRASLELTGGRVDVAGAYPGWKPVPDASIVKLMESLYRELFGDAAHVAAVHAGLECGILGQNYPEMEMISFGPNILGAHSPDERAQVSSVQKYWKLLLETLKRIPSAAAQLQ